MRPTADPLRIEDNDTRMCRHDLEQGRHRAHEHRGERLHALDADALGQLLAHVREHRHTLGEAPGPLANRGREEQFTHRRREHAVGREFQRPLVSHGEGANLLDGVTPELDSERVLLGRREHVENPTTHGELTTPLDKVDSVVAHVDKVLNRLGEVGGRVDCQPHRLDVA